MIFKLLLVASIHAIPPTADDCYLFCVFQLGLSDCTRGTYCKDNQVCHGLQWTTSERHRICMFGVTPDCPDHCPVSCSEAHNLASPHPRRETQSFGLFEDSIAYTMWQNTFYDPMLDPLNIPVVLRRNRTREERAAARAALRTRLMDTMDSFGQIFMNANRPRFQATGSNTTTTPPMIISPGGILPMPDITQPQGSYPPRYVSVSQLSSARAQNRTRNGTRTHSVFQNAMRSMGFGIGTDVTNLNRTDAALLPSTNPCSVS